MEPWVRKYRPRRTEEICGQTDVCARVGRYLTGFERGAKPLILAGSPGIGKTSIVEALAEELDFEVIEINASDTRNKAAIESLVGAASKQQSLFFRKRLILVDEVDGVSGVKDRGAVTTLAKIVAESSHPIIFTANDALSDKLKPLRKSAEILTIEPPSAQEITGLLMRIAEREKLSVDEGVLSGIAHRTGGDVRAAITDLQSLAHGNAITKEDLELLDEREHEESIEQALLRVFKTTSAEVALPAFDAVNMQPDQIMLWIEENLPREYTKSEDIARAMDALSEADRFFGRIRRWQYYRFYVYVYNLLSAGIAIAKAEKYKGVRQYKRSERPLKIWIANQKNLKRKRLAEQLAPHLHTSRRQMVQDVLPYLQYASKNRKLKDALVARYDLDKDASEWL